MRSRTGTSAAEDEGVEPERRSGLGETRVLAKLQLRDRVQVVIFAYEHDLISDR